MMWGGKFYALVRRWDFVCVWGLSGWRSLFLCRKLLFPDRPARQCPYTKRVGRITEYSPVYITVANTKKCPANISGITRIDRVWANRHLSCVFTYYIWLFVMSALRQMTRLLNVFRLQTINFLFCFHVTGLRDGCTSTFRQLLTYVVSRK